MTTEHIHHNDDALIQTITDDIIRYKNTHTDEELKFFLAALVQSLLTDRDNAIPRVELSTEQGTIAEVKLKPLTQPELNEVNKLPVSQVVIRNKFPGKPMSGCSTELTIDGHPVKSAHRVTFRVGANEPSVMVIEMLAPDVTIDTDTHMLTETTQKDSAGLPFKRETVTKSG